MPTEGEILTTSMRRRNSPSLFACLGDLAVVLGYRSIKEPLKSKVSRVIFLLLVDVVLVCLSVTARSQSLLDSGDPSSTQASTTSSQLDLSYERPTQRTKVNNYFFDAFGPYPIVSAAFGAGISQGRDTPPEWNQGSEGYAKRFGSSYSITAAGVTTRYALSEAFKEDALYYRCECRGVLPRLRHALISTLTARRGKDGHLVFSIPALVGPYVGSMIAVYTWYPNRFGAKDAFRMGNYSMLRYMGGNIALEFLYSGPHSLLHRMHLNNAHGSPERGPNH
jgi:hypothetical protein